MRALGLTCAQAACVVGVDASTVRRWKARGDRGLPRASPKREHAIAPAAEQAVREQVCALHGLVGADALRHSVPGISRRQAARIKASTLTQLERERKCALRHVSLTMPGIVRGMDGMQVHTAEGRAHALFTADAAVPYRTGVKLGRRYDTELVVHALAADMEKNGAPVVYRFDRASPHDSHAVRSLLHEHGVLVLHGPPHCPQFYGQHERLNREHRAWEDELEDLFIDEAEECLAEMLGALNGRWRRRTLAWKTAQELWDARPVLTLDREQLAQEVDERAARLKRHLQLRGKPADLAQRLAIEQALKARGWLRLTAGGGC
jgi:transposase InsO family protein